MIAATGGVSPGGTRYAMPCPALLQHLPIWYPGREDGVGKKAENQMDANPKFSDIIILSILPRGTEAEEFDCSPTLHWIEQDDEWYFSPFAEHIEPDGLLELVGERKSDVLLSVLDYGKNPYLPDAQQAEDLTWLALQIASTFKTIPDNPRNVAILPAVSSEGLDIASALVSAGASILYTNADAFRDYPLAVPFDSIVPVESLPEEYHDDGDEANRNGFCYLGAVPDDVAGDMARVELEIANGSNCYDLGYEFQIYHSWRKDFMEFLSFGREEVRGVGCIGRVNAEFFFSVPSLLRRKWPGYERYHAAVLRARDVFHLWEVGNALHERETGEDFWIVDGISRARQPEPEPIEDDDPRFFADPAARPFRDHLSYDKPDPSWIDDDVRLAMWQRRAEEIGIRSLVDAYYDGVPYEDLVTKKEEDISGVVRQADDCLLVPLYVRG